MFKLQRRIRPESERQDEEPDRFGWNLIGMFDHRGGIGNAARMNREVLKTLVGKSRSIAFPGNHYGTPLEVPAIHGFNYLHFNPSCIAIRHLEDVDWFKNGINIGYWAWETTRAPKTWKTYDKFMSQIWVPTEFVKRSLMHSEFEAPIFVIPHAVEARSAHLYPKPNEPITFLVQFDGQSRYERKRPDLSIAAITTAAAKTGEMIRILIKSHNRGTSQIAIPEYPNMQARTIDQWMEDGALGRLFDTADVLVSLNRGEGFGLPLMEAMARGTAVVATNYGGSLDYLRENNSYPVRVKKEEDAILAGDIYFKTGRWALPDVSHATEQIIQCMKDIRSGAIVKLAANARRTAGQFSTENMARKMKHALSHL